MLEINLLPREDQRLATVEVWRRAIIFFLGVFLVVFAAGSALLLPTYLSLLSVERELERSLAFEEEAAAQFRVTDTLREGEALLRRLERLKALAGFQSRASGVLQLTLGSSEDKGIVFTNVTVKEDGSISVSGRTETRGSMLRFEEQLRRSGYFEHIVSPLENIMRDRDINFAISGKLRPEYRLLQ